MKVYCAGPLFNQKEREEMADIAERLEKAGFEVFLPQRDGLEFAVCINTLREAGIEPEDASSVLSRAIFALDVYQVVEGCDAIVVNLNGRVPDEGAVAEAALAWMAGKTMFAYKADSRSLLEGCDNPLVAGLFEFRLYDDLDELVSQLKDEAHNTSSSKREFERKEEIQNCLKFGEKLWGALADSANRERIISVLLEYANAS